MSFRTSFARKQVLAIGDSRALRPFSCDGLENRGDMEAEAAGGPAALERAG